MLGIILYVLLIIVPSISFTAFLIFTAITLIIKGTNDFPTRNFW